jgi:subtilisin family serine protease
MATRKKSRRSGPPATANTVRRGKSKTRALSAAERERSEPRSPIFVPGVSDIIPGEVILQLREETASQITESIARGPRRGLRHAGATAFGLSELDSALDDLKVVDIVRLHPPAPIISGAMELAAPMASTFRLSFEEDTPVDRAVERLAGVGGVEFVEPNRYRETYVVPNDPSFAAQWGLTRIKAPDAWDQTTGSSNVTVAVIDTGVDLDHAELAPLLVPGTDMVDLGPNPTPPPGFRFEGDFQGRDNIPQDEVGHGTHVAGTIACLSNNNVGVAGVTWSCRLMPVKVLTRIVNVADPTDVRGTGSAADIAAGIRWAVDNGARVLNLSLGGTTDTQVERDAIAYAIAHGAVVVAAMGNSFQQGNPTSYPAAYPDVVAVGAIGQADTRAAFSQTGPHIDIAAPGVGVLSTVWDNGYTSKSGTSMASPHVAGVAALVLSCNTNLTGPQVADILRQTARSLRDNPTDPIPNDSYGFGCVDAQAAVQRACPRRTVLCKSVITCPPASTVISCRTLLCPSHVTCPVPSVVTVCQSLVVCPSQITCPRPSVVTLCPSLPITGCPQVSIPLPLCPRPSVTIRCPSGPVCGIDPGRPPIGGAEGAAGGSAYDPYGQWGGEWSDYDPYGGNYGEGSGY